ncbi:MAG TPA: hypothetical protein VN018_05320 [Brevundimonas sp.]|nr:hypothetical protein [Brevundimonas sp.]
MSIPQVKADLAAALRDYVVSGVPASGPNDPAKLALRAALIALADLTLSSGTTLVFSTIAEMEAAPNPATLGARAEVRADPAGNVEDGNGVWSWGGVGPGWSWISDLIPSYLVDAAIAAVPQPVVWMQKQSRVRNEPILETAPGFVLPNNTGIDVRMAWTVEDDPDPEFGWGLGVEGITTDLLPFRYRDNSDLPPSRPAKGDTVYFTRNGETGAYNLLDLWDAGRAKPDAGAAPPSFIVMTKVSRVQNEPVLKPMDGFHLPNNTGYGALMVWMVEDNPSVGFTWSLGVEGITLDKLQLRYRDNSAVETSRPRKGDLLFFTRNPASGDYAVLDIWDADRGKPGSVGGGPTPYQRVISAWTNSTARAALTLARRP